MNLNLKRAKKSPLLWLYVGGAVLLLVAAWLWYAKVSVSPERVFWGTIERSLATRGVTVNAEMDNNGTSAKETIRYSMGAENLSHSITTLSRGGTTVKNETIATPTADYTRYLSIKTDQKKANGGNIDFSKVLGVWAKGQDGAGQSFAQAIFGASLPVGGVGVPIGNLSPKVRADLIKQVKDDNVYQISFDKVKKERVDGRLIYTYDADVQPMAYVGLMKKFSQNIGLHGLDQLDPQSYKNQKSFELSISVDARARQVVSISNPTSPSKQTYSDYDVPVQVSLPKNPISMTQLQQIISGIQ